MKRYESSAPLRFCVNGSVLVSAAAKEILDEYQGVTQEDIQACLLFASRSLEDTSFMSRQGGKRV